MERTRALVVDKDPAVRAVIRDLLQERGVMALGAGTHAEAVETLRSRPVEIVIVDTPIAGGGSADLVQHALRLSPAPVVIGLLTRDDEALQDELLGDGLFDVAFKPLDQAQLRRCFHRATSHMTTTTELRELRTVLQSREGYSRLVGRSAAMERARRQIDSLAAGDGPVWFFGEEGVGKELAGRTLHAGGERSPQSFVVVDCSEISEVDWEGRWTPRSGGSQPIDLAMGGTIYLDALPEMSPALQERLVAVLDGDLFRSTNQGEGDAAIRVISASVKDPREEVERGRLHEELFRRLGQQRVGLPALRDRVEDIGLLARHFVSTIVEVNHLHPIQVLPQTLELLERYSWPGNVQELRNAVEHAVILAVDGKLQPRDLPERVGAGAGGIVEVSGAAGNFRVAKREVIETFERAYLAELLHAHRGNVTSAAQHAGMLRSALQRLLRKYGMKSADYRKARRQTAGAEAAASRVD